MCSVRKRLIFFFQAEDGIRDIGVTGVETCALPIYHSIHRNRLCVRPHPGAPRICLWRGPHPCTGTTTHREDYLPASPHRLPTTSPDPALVPAPDPRKNRTRVFGRLASLGSAWAFLRGYGNINPLSIDYACRPRLRSRLTLGGLAWPRNPWSSGGGGSHSPVATHACILTRVASTAGSLRRFTRHTTLPYPPHHLAATPEGMPAGVRWSATASAGCLSPPTFLAREHLTSELFRTLGASPSGPPRPFTRHTTLPYPPHHLAATPEGMPAGVRWSATASAVCLSPATLSARNHLTSELLRTLSRMAASKPTSWLSG